MNDLTMCNARLAAARPIGFSAANVISQTETFTVSPKPLQKRHKFVRYGFSIMAGLIDFIAIIGAAFAANFSFNYLKYGVVDSSANIIVGCFAAIMFVALNIARHYYAVSNYLDLSGPAQRTFMQWNIAFMASAALGFLTQAMEFSSRGAFILFYFTGLCALFSCRAALVLLAQRHACNNGVLASRIIVVGFKADIESFMKLRQPEYEGISVIATRTLSESGPGLDDDLAAATGVARALMPDDIYIVVPWSQSLLIDKCVSAFMGVPASIHLNIYPNSPINRFASAQLGVNGGLSSLSLRGRSMRSVGAVLKRIFDIGLALAALILLFPVLILAALAIKLESKGPIFFHQNRRGFNKVQFRIIKFRTMNTMEDGFNVKQVVPNDPRITRVGRVLRKWNTDELPQLLNVLRGEMSIVGPRPHALVHDELFETEVSLYARRHNVKPGITGWAQVNGFRGETGTPDKIANRIRYDLHYIDNWTFVFDIWIIFLTAFSRRAYQNAH